MKISFEEFSELPKKRVGKRNLEPGKNYYIQESKGKYKAVYKGTYLSMNDKGDYNRFENVEFVVNPFNNSATPFGFNNKSGFIFTEVMEPTFKERSMKNKTINELTDFISEKKMEPYDSVPTISFIGQDYRTARDRFNTTNNVTKTRRSSSSSSSTARGLKKRKTTKKRRLKKRN
jgi:hypothetical protein